MRIYIIACRVLNRELSYLAATSPHTVEIAWLPQGLHDTPDMLRAGIINELESLYRRLETNEIKQRPDVIALGYGLCSNGVIGVECRDIPIVIPRTDDCIALFLGSQKRYLELFNSLSGTYWLNNGWIEACGTLVRQRETKEMRRQMYIERYGEDNADYLMEMESQWAVNYSYCGFIHSPVFEPTEYPCMARRVADENGWEYKEIDGDIRMLRALTHGEWNDDEFLILKPGEMVAAEYTGRKLKAVPAVKASPEVGQASPARHTSGGWKPTGSWTPRDSEQ